MAAQCALKGSARPSRALVLVFDFGSQVSRLIVRRLRAIGVYSELLACSATAEEVAAARPAAVILSGGPSSVYEEGAPHIRRDVWELLLQKKVPILGICYGMQEIVHQLGGRVVGEGHREFGKTAINLCPLPVEDVQDDAGAEQAAPGAAGEEWSVPAACAKTPALGDLFHGIEGPQVEVWMSHGDKVENLPSSFVPLAATASCPFVAAASPSLGIYALQFHPEVTHTPCGAQLLRNFAQRIARLELTWDMQHFLPEQIENLKKQVGDSPVIGALSGGVDSTVAAALLHRAIGRNFHGFLVDTGLLRKNEAAETMVALRKCFPDMDLECIDASERFLSALEGVTDPEKKRKIIGAMFIEVFEDAVKAKNLQAKGTYLLQGTLYPDVIESKSYKGPSHVIKTHHNVGGLPERMSLQVLEPLRDLFKDEVREMGRSLGLPEERVMRHPFPGPGLAVRIIGAVNAQRVKLLQDADAVFIEEIRKAGLYDQIGQAFAVLLPECRSVGVMGDGRTYECACVLRAVETTDFMTADWFKLPLDVLAAASSRITNEVRGINRVVYDISSKPPATIEWE